MAKTELTDSQLRKNGGQFIHEYLFIKEINDLKNRIETLENKP